MKKIDCFRSNRLIHKLILAMMFVTLFFITVSAWAVEIQAANDNSDSVVQSNKSHGKWVYNSGKGHPVCDGLLKRLNHYSWSGDKDERNYCARRIALSYPEFEEPPWQNLDPTKHEELIFRMFRKSSCGAVSGVVDEKPRSCHDAGIRNTAKKFIEEGGRLQIWRTNLLSKYLDGTADAHAQTIARILWKRNIDQYANKYCPVEDKAEWAESQSFIVKDDLSDLDPKTLRYSLYVPHSDYIEAGKAFFYSGKLYYILNSGDAVLGAYFKDDRLVTFCELIYKESKERKQP